MYKVLYECTRTRARVHAGRPAAHQGETLILGPYNIILHSGLVLARNHDHPVLLDLYLGIFNYTTIMCLCVCLRLLLVCVLNNNNLAIGLS